MQPNIPVDLAAALPLLGEIASRTLADDRQKPVVNAIIAFVLLVVVAVVCCWLAGNFTGNLQASVLLVVVYCALLMHGSLSDLMQFFDDARSPLASILVRPKPVVVDAQPPLDDATKPMSAVKPASSSD